MMKRKKGNDRKERKKGNDRGRKERDEKGEERDRGVNRKAFFHSLFFSFLRKKTFNTFSNCFHNTQIHHSSSYVLCQENDHYFLI